MVYLYLFN